MGREIRRVPLDFAWPLNKRYEGFLNPHYKPCPGEGVTCFSGCTAAGRWLDALCRFIAVLGEDAGCEPYAAELRARGRTWPHPYLQEFPQAPHYPMPRAVEKELQKIEDDKERMRAFYAHHVQNHPQLLPFTPDMVRFVMGLADGEECGLGGGASYKIRKSLLKAAHIRDENWDICKICGGDAMDPVAKEAYESWEEVPPPEGPGWQLWETVSEGSPISPVFPDGAAFKAYLLAQGYSKKAADNFIKIGSCVSFATQDGKIYKDIESTAVE